MEHKERREAIINMRKECPCYTLDRIGGEFGVTRERVRQILEEENLHTKHFVAKVYCQRCGVELFKYDRSSPYCKQCNYELHHVELTCDGCGVKFWRKVSSVLKYACREQSSYTKDSKLSFCSRQCLGKYCGKKYGLAVHPEVRAGVKLDGEEVHNKIVLALSQRREGETDRSLVRRFGINHSTFIRYKRKYGADYRNYPVHRLSKLRESLTTSVVTNYADIIGFPLREIAKMVEDGNILRLPNTKTIRWRMKNGLEYYTKISLLKLDNYMYLMRGD